MKKTIGFLLICGILLFTYSAQTVYADRLTELQNQKLELEKQESELQQQAEDTQSAMDEANSTASELQGSIEELSYAMDEITCSIIEIMAEITLIEEDIEQKELDISVTQQEYETAVSIRDRQYQEMCIRIKYMYETGNEGYVELLLTAQSIPDMLNKADYVEALYQYDRDMLLAFQQTTEMIAELEAKLELELAELEDSKSVLDEVNEELNLELAVLQKESANFEYELAQAKYSASTYAKLLKEQKGQLSQVQKELKETNQKISQEQATLQAQNNSGSSNVRVPAGSATFNANDIWNANGSDYGKQIAVYACSFIGNPYVFGGTSLTNGTDCSGFTQSVYAQFSIKIPRTSTEQRYYGTEISYEEAQPGDLICYRGHVGMYIGNGKIVHASGVKTGIKISSAKYRTIVSVRRVL